MRPVRKREGHSRSCARLSPRKYCAVPALAALFLALFLQGAPSIRSQTRWFKYEGNPVLNVGPLGSWDGILVIPSRVIHTDSVYHMWYTGFSGTRYWHIGYATSPDGIRWRKYEGNPILRAGPATWDSSGTALGYVMQTGSDYQMWYNGDEASRTLQLGYAASADGIAWRKAHRLNPILRVGPRGSWNSGGLSHPSVLGPDSSGHYKMWFAGEDRTVVVKVGFATGTSATSWTMAANPVLEPGTPGSWDDRSVFYPRVLHNHGTYEMWYGGLTSSLYASRKVGYATSPDGVHWAKSPENPVLTLGPEGAWDDYSVLVGDVSFDGQFYHLWYQGLDADLEVGVGQIGYAISPAEAHIDINPSYVAPGDTVQIRMHTALSAQLSLRAEIRSRDGIDTNRIVLQDDGRHGDGLPSDGISANSWVPQEEADYVVRLKLQFENRTYVLDEAGAFSTIGPLKVEGLELLGDTSPNPGDTLFAKIRLRNHGRSAAARSVEASLFATDSLVTDVVAASPSYGDIAAAGSAVSHGFYRLFLSPKCPAYKDVKLKLSISSAGVPYWQDTIVLKVLPPWWRTPWAFVVYALGLAGAAVTTVRFIGGMKLKRRVRQLEREQALQRERTRISQDMHDEVGARLTEIGILGELARKDIVDRQKTEARIQKITETSREIIASISQIIWAMDPRNDALEDLVAYLREYASKYLGTAGIACEFDLPDAVPGLQLSAEARRNIFLVAKEALHNVVKHSGATLVRMLVEVSSQHLRMEIVDNGQGFDVRNPSPGGNGLRNMARRMNDVGGTLEIVSSSGGGTRVRMEVGFGAR